MSGDKGGDRLGSTGRMEVPPGVPARLQDLITSDDMEYAELAPLRRLGKEKFEALVRKVPAEDDLSPWVVTIVKVPDRGRDTGKNR